MNPRQIYDEHFAFVWRSLRRLGVRESDVPDAVQDVFIVVFRRLAEFEGRSKMSTWIFGICYRVASDRRKAARRVHIEETCDDRWLEAPDERVDIAAETERRQGLQKLEALLDALPFEQRAVFTLFELECMTGEDIAQTLAIPLGTVYSRLRLAREAFSAAAARLRARDRSILGPIPPPVANPSILLAGGKR